VGDDTAVGPSKYTEFTAGLLAIAATSCFAVAFAIIKYLTVDLTEPVIAFFRGVFASLLFLPMLVRRGFGFFATTRPIGHIWRSVFGFGSFLIFVYALRLLPLGDVVALSYTSPFWSILLAAAVFRERISLRLAGSVAVGFLGVWLIARPSGQMMIGAGAATALTGALATSLAMMMVKQLSTSEPPDRITFYFVCVGGVIAIIPAAFDWRWPAPHHWPGLMAIGALFYCGQFCLTRAYAHGTMSRIAPLDFVRLPIALVLGFTAFGEVPTVAALAGMALIVLASLDILFFGLRKTA
jgi:drug/metabolite transporter (DMT)-like permease